MDNFIQVLRTARRISPLPHSSWTPTELRLDLHYHHSFAFFTMHYNWTHFKWLQLLSIYLDNCEYSYYAPRYADLWWAYVSNSISKYEGVWSWCQTLQRTIIPSFIFGTAFPPYQQWVPDLTSSPVFYCFWCSACWLFQWIDSDIPFVASIWIFPKAHDIITVTELFSICFICPLVTLHPWTKLLGHFALGRTGWLQVGGIRHFLCPCHENM